jgi:hypothetical protein
MPQGLLKKIKVELLLRDLPLELYDPTPRRRTLAGQNLLRPLALDPFWPTRSTTAAQPRRTLSPHHAAPLVHPLPLHTQRPRNFAGTLPGLHPTHCLKLQLLRVIPRSPHQFLSFSEKLSGFLLSHFRGALHSISRNSG